MQQPFDLRSNNDIRQLMPIVQSISFLKKENVKPRDFPEVCFSLQYMERPAGSFVVKFGDKGDKFFVLLKGKVEVWIPAPIK